MYLKLFLFLTLAAKGGWSQDDDEDDDGPYRGKLIGKLNSYHHQVSGAVYAADEHTLLLERFTYDGTADDAFFWAGDSGRPGPMGFIIPDQHGKTNVLERYYDASVRLRLPDGKRVSRLAWFSIYDLSSQNAFGDVYVPDDFEPPAPRRLPPLSGPGVSSGPLQVLDDRTVLVPDLRLDGPAPLVWRVGSGPAPHAKGAPVPDERGYLEPLTTRPARDARLTLPGDRGVRGVSWLALWDEAAKRAVAHVLLPERLNVPPSAARPLPAHSALPHCVQLHRDLQLSWEVFGGQLSVQLTGRVAENEYMAFGVSGDEHEARMVGADVAVVQYSSALRRALAADYNVSAAVGCGRVLGALAGVCRDSAVGGADGVQLLTAARADGVTAVTYRRQLAGGDAGDRSILLESLLSAVWAVGRLDAAGEPSYHRLAPRRPLLLNLTRDPPYQDCFAFLQEDRPAEPSWERAELADPALRVFHAMLGPGGGSRGRPARGEGGAQPLAWYVNGQLAPDLQLRRGLSYTVKVSGGADPHAAGRYHPLVVTTEPRGGLDALGDVDARAVRVLAGVSYTRRGRAAPSAAGPLCEARRPPTADPRRDDDFPSFRAFNRTLSYHCEPGAPAELQLTPNSSWPDVVYYHSFTQADMGGRILVVDKPRRPRRGAAPPPPLPPRAPAALLALALMLLR